MSEKCIPFPTGKFMADTARDPRLEQDLLKSDIFRFFPSVSVKVVLIACYCQTIPDCAHWLCLLIFQ